MYFSAVKLPTSCYMFVCICDRVYFSLSSTHVGATGHHSQGLQKKSPRRTQTQSTSNLHTGSQQQSPTKQQRASKTGMTHTSNSATNSPFSSILCQNYVRLLGDTPSCISNNTDTFFQPHTDTTSGKSIESSQPVFRNTAHDEHHSSTAPTHITEENESDNPTPPNSPPEIISQREKYSSEHTQDPQYWRSKSSPAHTAQRHDHLQPSRALLFPQQPFHGSETSEGAPELQVRWSTPSFPNSHSVRPGVMQASDGTHFARQQSSYASTPTCPQEASLGSMGTAPTADSPTPQPSSRRMSSSRALRGLDCHIDLQVQRVEFMLEELSRTITSSSELNWAGIGRELYLEDTVLQDIDQKYHFPEEKCYQMLCCAIRRSMSSYRNLRDAFNEMELYDLCAIIRKARTDIYGH